jgi:uncharacterized RDD family membrane protein YckC
MINNYYLLEDGQKIGPFSHFELMDQEIGTETLVLSPITNEWQSAAYLPEFYEYFQTQGIYYPISSILANFWWRLLAYAIDYVLLILLMSSVGIAFGLVLRFTGISLHWEDEHDTKLKLITVIIFLAYNSGFEATRMQGSIGKTICGLKVVNAQGQRINFSNALGRNAGKLLSSLVLGMGYLNIFWDKHRQGWHDQMAKTYVIRKP